MDDVHDRAPARKAEIVIPTRNRGRQSVAAQLAYQEQVEEFCRRIEEIRASLDFEVSARGWCYILEEHGATKADFPTIERLFVACRKSGDLPIDICADVQDYLARFGARKVEANALVVRPEAGRRLCLEAVRRYVPDPVLADFEARRAEAQIEARSEILQLLAAS
jgi:hypothetical protein